MRTKIATMAISAFLLVSMISVFQAGTASAGEGSVELGSTHNGVAEWTDETAGVGAYSVKLFWPAPYRDANNNYIVPRAFVKILNIPSGLTISDVNSWSYWAKAPKNYTPNLTFYVDHSGIDNPDGKDYDTTISTNLLGGDGTWTEINETTIPDDIYGSYVLWINSDTAPVYGKTWTSIQEGFTLWGKEHNFGDSVVKHVKIGKGVIGTNREITAYVDDAVIGSVTYTLETSPLQAVIDELNAKNAKLEGQLKTSDATIVSLNIQIGNLQDRITELKTVEIVDLEKQIDALEQEISSLNAQIFKLEASGVADYSTISALNAEVANMQSQINNLRGQLLGKNTTVSRLQRERSELEKNLKYWKSRPRSTRVIVTEGIGEEGGQVVFAAALGVVGIMAMLCVKSFTGPKKSKKG